MDDVVVIVAVLSIYIFVLAAIALIAGALRLLCAGIIRRRFDAHALDALEAIAGLNPEEEIPYEVRETIAGAAYIMDILENGKNK